jgi:FG-GAP-like repeat/FG-GAP repeat
MLGDAMSHAAPEFDKPYDLSSYAPIRRGAAVRQKPTPKWLRLRALALLIALPLFSSCDDQDYGCGNCYVAAPQENSLGLVAGNFNNNGHTSVIATSTVVYQPQFNPGNLKSYLSTGAGAFGPPKLTADGDDPLYLASADLNGDHLPDVVSASFADGTLTVFLNNATTPGTFGAPLTLSSPGASQVAIGDMNGDGLPDLVSADFNVSLFIQTSPGTFASPVSLYSGGANWVAVGDLNGDGIPDIALTDAVGVKLLMHTGAAGSVTYAAPVSVFTQSVNPGITGANLIAIADVNGDGLNDLVITDPGPVGSPPAVNILLQDAKNPGTFLSPVSYSLPGNSIPQSITVADVNGDGHPDIVIGGSTAVSVFLQDASSPGVFLAANNYTVTNANEVAVADVNGDGLVDIVVPIGVSHPTVSGVITNNPGVLLQVAGSLGTFSAVQDLP